MKFLRVYGKHFLRVLLHIFYIFPIKNNRLIFNSMMWKQYSCNPKYITEYLLNKYPNQFEIVWAFVKPDQYDYLKEKGIQICKARSLTYYFYRLTSKVSICNATMGSEVPPRKGQYRINTWHGGGGGYKKTDYSSTDSYWPRKEMSETDLFCASSKTSLENTVRKAFCHSGDVFLGTPRNDVFVNGCNQDMKQVIHDYFKIENEIHIALYAPTYREGKDVYHYSDTYDYGLDYKKLYHALCNRFGGEWMIAVRYHNRVSHYELPQIPMVVDATGYLDMQELMLGVELMITDYSSSLWDFSFSGKPCFLFCNDLDEYIQKRGFNKPIEEWGFPIARSNEELNDLICNWSEAEYHQSMDNQHIINGSFEDGNATERLCEIIYNKCIQS